MRLLLVRHGQTPSNVVGLLDTALPGPGLTALGSRQAAAVPEALADRVVHGVAVSTLVRTHQTAAPLVEHLGLDPVELDGLREIDAGDLEMSGRHEDHVTYLETVFAWGARDLGRRMPGGPDGATFLDRFDDAVAQVAGAGWETAVVVSHGAAIRSWASARAEGVDLHRMAYTPLANTGLVEVEGDPVAGWRFVGVSDGPLGGHLLEDELADDPTGESVGEERVDAER
ncbi:histidine phosphatase family protein [Cellulosimicrobium marinum]|uniref:histidine phosphatase family protein n=1 Tax=Cellulosimicrobium marinum TaxID=1638992 RepID=UPI001E5D7F3A|nr:histidine phosphatase family protein [Cellulosimicrobium marinum]MCB7136055.1 histidine phosphatase family protein [Cellulosimicrobium marinum]